MNEVQVFSMEWFNQKQRSLLFLLNNPLTKVIMRKILDISFKEQIVKITPYEFVMDKGQGKYALETHIARKFGIRLYSQLATLWNLCHQFDMFVANKYFPAFNLGFDTLPVYPDPSGGSTTMDGRVSNSTSPLNWTTCRNSATGTVSDTTAQFGPMTSGWKNTSQDSCTIMRPFFLFDTHSIPALSKIDNATLSIFAYGGYDIGNVDHDINIYSSNPASNTSLTTADYNKVGSTPFSTAITVDSWAATLEVYKNFVLNADGKANIAMGTGAVSKFSARNANYDVSGNPPIANGGANGQSETIQGYYADDITANNGKDPKLYVEFTLPSTGYGKVIFISR